MAIKHNKLFISLGLIVLSIIMGAFIAFSLTSCSKKIDSSSESISASKSTYTLTFRQDGQDDIVYIINANESFREKLPEPVQNETGYIISWNFRPLDLRDFTKDVIITTKKELKKYPITYELGEGGGTNLNPTEYTILSDEIVLQDPKKYGYTFIGWTGSNGDTISKDVKVEFTLEELNYIAHWTPNDYVVMLDVNGGNPIENTTYTLTFGETYTLEVPTREGYDFKGWGWGYNIDSLIASDENGKIKWESTGSTILYANWAPKKITVTLDVNGGKPLSTNTKEVIYTQSYTLLEPQRDGYEFLGWSANLEGDPLLTSNLGCSLSPWNIPKDTTLYAIWKAKSYTLLLKCNNLNAGHLTKNSTTLLCGNTIEVTAITNSGYTFVGWYIGLNNVCTTETFLYTMTPRNETITATWKPNIYTVTLDVNDGDELKNNTSEITYYSDYKLPVPTKIGHTFLGWGTNTTGALVTYAGGKNKLPWQIAEDTTLYANWKKNVYNLTVEVNNINAGTVNKTSDTITYTSSTTLFATTNEGYTFDGWYDGNTKVSDNNCFMYCTPARDSTLVATWKTNVYTITYKLNGGTNNVDNPDTYTIENHVTFKAPTRDGYTFSHWVHEWGEIKKTDNTLEDLNIVAIWTANEYNITYYTYGSINDPNNPSSYNIENDDITLLSPSTPSLAAIEGLCYTVEPNSFEGWYLESSYVTKVTSIPKGTYGDIKLYAKYKTSLISFTEYLQKGGIYRINELNNYDIDGMYLYHGYYPQTLKTDEVTITSSTPNDDGYYLGSDNELYLKYTVSISNDYLYFADGTKVENGVEYYFKLEPIKWQILTINENQIATLLSEKVLIARKYDPYKNNYENSEIRSWLNEEFYNSVFTDGQKAKIQTTEVDNSPESAGYKKSDYACDNTLDKVFLLSVKEINDEIYGLTESSSRIKYGSDYARATGIYMYKSNDYTKWRLRSPSNEGSKYTNSVSNFGGILNNEHINNSIAGIAPSINITMY